MAERTTLYIGIGGARAAEAVLDAAGADYTRTDGIGGWTDGDGRRWHEPQATFTLIGATDELVGAACGAACGAGESAVLVTCEPIMAALVHADGRCEDLP